MSKTKLTEHDEQCCVMDWWAKCYKRYYLCLFAIPNGAVLAGNPRKRATQMNSMKAEGLRPGVSDLFLAIPKGKYHGFFIEMKKSGSTKSSVRENQLEFMADMRDQGYKAEWYAGWKSATDAIDEYMKKGE